MSGIFGSVALDGTMPSTSDLDAMAKVLATRGPDGTHHWRQGNVALGHTLLATTPEALVEVLPLTDPETGCTITADVRLDNREELIPELGLEGIDRVIGDGELILRAYLRWGEECPAKLLGDFAFAIWDPREQHLFCARDHMGMRQLIYHHEPGKLFIFASQEAALLSHPSIPKDINEARIGDFLERMEGIDFTSTFFERLLRLPGAHALTASTRNLRIRRYWRLRIGPELKLQSSAEYAIAFREVFADAVQCRLRSVGPVGCLLSGGIDSNSVAAIAAHLLEDCGQEKLRTFSAIGESPSACRETRFIRCATGNPNFIASTVSHDALTELQADLSHGLEASASPFDAHMTMTRAAYSVAHRQGVRVVLDGAGSDLALAAGNRIAQLLRRGQFRRAASEARCDARFWGDHGAAAVILGAAWVAFIPRPLRALRQKLIGRLEDRRATQLGRRVNVPFANKIALAKRMQSYRRHIGIYSPTDRGYRIAQIGHPHTSAGRERYDRVASAAGIEPRDPFLDIRVIQFCLSLPANELKSDGWTKLVLRRAMRGLVPNEILQRRGKENVGSAFTRRLVRDTPAWKARWSDVSELLGSYVSPKLLSREPPFGHGPARPVSPAMDPDTFIELFALGCWLERNHVPKG